MHSERWQFATVEQAIEAIRNGEMLIVADDEDRENEGDLICAAELVTPEMINFMAKRASGLICLALTPRARRPARARADRRRQHRRAAAPRTR